MDCEVFKLGAGMKLIPICFDGVEIGNRVRYASNYGIYTVIGQDRSGFIIANGKGDTHSGQQLESLSPFTRIEVLANLPNATPEEINSLKESVEEKRQADLAQMNAEAQQKRIDFEGFLTQLKKDYPNASQTGSNCARASKNIKNELKQAFPSVKFSVRSESFSMGNSISISWENGCTVAQVEAVTDKYKNGQFNSSDDMYDYRTSAYSDAVSEWLGSANYISTARTIDDGIKKQVREAIIASYNGKLEGFEVDQKVNNILYRADITGEFIGLELEAGQFVAKFKVEEVKSPSPNQEGSSKFETKEFTHTTKGTTCFVAVLTEKVSKDKFKEILQSAKTFGGFYSSFTKGDAVAGFVFNTSEKRTNFLNLYR